ncbi:MAG: hypothetical protein ACR2HJ_11665 [Fimbriimonadales bacterium]
MGKIFAIVFAMGAAQPQQPDLHWVATVDGMGISLVHVGNLMQRAKIPALIMGSRSYGVSVERSDLERAIIVIRKDAKVRPYHYIEARGVKSVGLPDEKTWKVHTLNVAWDELANSAALKADANLYALAKNGLRQARTYWRKEKRKPHVQRVSAFDMEYLADDMKFRHGYVAVVYVSLRGWADVTGEFHMWAWDHGGRVQTRWASIEVPNP